MEEGLSRLEARVDALAGSLEQMEARLRALEDRTPPSVAVSASPAGEETQPPPAGAPPLPRGPQAVPILSLVGQSCLVLCGAFLLRAMTDMAVLPTQLGLAVGLVYAIGWLLFADFLGRGSKHLGATFFGVSSVVIAYPLVSEAATTFGAVGGLGSGVALSVFTAIALAVAWRRDLSVLGWLTTLAAMGTAFVLVVATHRMVPFAAGLLLLGVGSVWLAYSRGWAGLQWLPAMAVDLLISGMVHLGSRPQGIPESYPDVSVPAALTATLGLLLAYLASFAGQTLLRRWDVGGFEVAQTAAVLVVGFGGAVHVAEASGMGSIALGAGALVMALVGYSVAFAFAELRWGYGGNHLYYAWLAFVLSIAGAYLVTSGFSLLLSLCAASLATAVLGARYKRATLYYQSAAYAVAAASFAAEVPGGLVTFAVEVFTSPADQPWPRTTIAGLAIVVGTAVVSYMVLGLSKAGSAYPWKLRISRFAVALVAALGGSAVLVVLLSRALGSQPPEADAAVVAAVRSGVVAGAAVALAALSRIPKCLDLRWLVYPLFVFGALKLALEDLRQGRPTTLFIAFAFYGIALILAPRLTRSGQHRGRAPSEAQEG
jgi:hypothetical protein